MKKIKLSKDFIDGLFEKEKHQADILIAIFKNVIPDWDSIKRIVGWPKVNDFTWKYICSKFMEFDRKNHPDVMCGGLWFNSGFSKKDELSDWFVDMSDILIVN